MSHTHVILDLEPGACTEGSSTWRSRTWPQRARRACVALIAALAGGATKEDAAKAAKVSARTVSRRCDDDEFMAQVEDAQQDLIRQTTVRLSATAGQAVATRWWSCSGRLSRPRCAWEQLGRCWTRRCGGARPKRSNPVWRRSRRSTRRSQPATRFDRGLV